MTEASSVDRQFPDTRSFRVVDVQVNSPRYARIDTRGFNIRNMVSEINLYEHIDKPYITGNMFIADPPGGISITNSLNLKGTENLLIKLKTASNNVSVNGDNLEIEKKFIITEVIAQNKSTDRSEGFIIHFIEDHAYLSALKNLNRSYNGTVRDIIGQILSDELKKEMLVRPEIQYEPFQDKFTKVIIPNLNPLKAVNWLKDRVTTEKGYPYYLYSSIGDDKLRFLDLETMLEQKALNDEPLPPYVYGSATQSTEPGGASTQAEAFNILEYYNSRSENSLELARRGYIGARYNFVDTTSGRQEKVDFHILDVYKDLMNRNLLDEKSQVPTYDFEAVFENELGDARMDQFATREITTYITSNQYQDYNEYGSYHDAATPELCKNKVIAKSLRYWLHKSPMTIVVPGRNFMKKNSNMTLGNKINVLFLSASSDTGFNSDLVDRKKSGSYLINSAKHTFVGQQTNDQKYSVTLDLIRLGGVT